MQYDIATAAEGLALAGSRDPSPVPPTMDSGLSSPAVLNMSLPMLLGVGAISNHTNPGTNTMGSRLSVSSLSFNTSLPLLGVGLVTLLLSLCFCCYLWKLKREAHTERGYNQLKYYPQSKKMKNDMCPVCLEEFEPAEKVAVSRCRHGFHTKCLQQWLDQHNSCPMCKAQVSATGQAGETTGLITSNV